ncbi:MAG TPA: hypothetical protein VJ953_13430 [Saprospiraceae bacterium]|nr:hypothetical protein [Saprospiraceae bacterium]
MKTLSYLLLGGCCLLLLANCQRNRYTPTETSEEFIRFGSGGGFTGARTTFTLMDNGQLFRHESLTDSTSLLPRVKRKVYKEIFNTLHQVDTTLLGAQQPGNRYYFLDWVRPEQSIETTWGSTDYKVPSEVQSTYQGLMKLVRTEE